MAAQYKMTYVGIDPGINGAIAVLADGQLTVHRMPTAMVGQGKTKKKRLDASGLADLLLSIFASSIRTVVAIENVHAMPKQGVTSMFNFGVSKGMCIGVCAGMRILFRLVNPQTWKRYWRLEGKDKEAARKLAQDIFPATKFKRVDDADAALIALWLQDNWPQLEDAEKEKPEKVQRKKKQKASK